MARSKGFDPDRVLDSAMHTFWKQGYAATSAQDLCEATGIGRSSLYGTFESKHGLYMRSLERYAEAGTAGLRGLVEAEGPVRERVRRLLDGVVEEEASRPGLGCFVVNAQIERAPSDPDVASVGRRGRQEVVDALARALRAAQADGEIAADKDPEALADFVHAQIGAIRLLGRSQAERTTMEHVVDAAVGAL